MNNTTERIVYIASRTTGETAQTLVVTGWSARDFDKMWDGLVRKIDFEKWMPVFDPERGDDQTIESWLA